LELVTRIESLQTPEFPRTFANIPELFPQSKMQYVSPFANLQKQLFGLNELKTFQDLFSV